VKIWIDLSNSPHPLLFTPIGRELERRGHTVLVTARDNAQTLELARERWNNVEAIGGPSPRSRVAKAAAVARRVRDLREWATTARPDVALSHNSYAQIAAARSLGIRAVTAMDYEHQPSNHLAFRLAHRILLPEALPLRTVRMQGARPPKVRRYPGLKEQIYLGDFEPDPNILACVGIDREPETVVVALRGPPVGALYHQFGNPLFAELLKELAARSQVCCVVLTRTDEQRATVECLNGNFVAPTSAIDSRSLLYASDLFIGADGTMTREAALLGVPTLTIYAGRPPAVELWLERQGLLSRQTSSDLDGPRPRTKAPTSPERLREQGNALVDLFVEETLGTAIRGGA
jgi:uncharacterized protein